MITVTPVIDIFQPTEEEFMRILKYMNAASVAKNFVMNGYYYDPIEGIAWNDKYTVTFCRSGDMIEFQFYRGKFNRPYVVKMIGGTTVVKLFNL